MKQKRLAHCWQGVAIRNTVRGAIAISTLFFSIPTAAQIVPDATLPVNSIVTPNGNTLTINGGSRAGSNLFHSFQEFSLPTGSEAFFNNAVDVQNIFSRVTGSNISNIDGLIRANGGANLFLLNPAGIVFGPNAKLNMGGSFFGTTADSIRFADGVQFSATSPSASPLLTISVPIGLQMGQNPGAIQVQGNGHNLRVGNRQPALGAGNSASGLRVQPGKTLALVGGDITLNGGILTAPAGQIAIASVGSGIVGLQAVPQGWNLTDDGIQTFQNIAFTNAALLDTTGNGGGSTQLLGARVSVTGNSWVLSVNTGAKAPGKIEINASELVEISEQLGSNRSRLFSETNGSGNGADIVVTAPQVLIRGSGLILANGYSTGNAGNITVQASKAVHLESSVGLVGIASNVHNTSKGSEIVVSAPEVRLLNGSLISASTFTSGSAANVVVNASDTIEVSGVFPPTALRSAISSASFAAGKTGDVTINTGQLRIANGGEAGTFALAGGSAGNVRIHALESVEVSGQFLLPGLEPRLSRISAGVFLANQSDNIVRSSLPSQPSGTSGNVTIDTSFLGVTDNAQISVTNYGTGNAGNIGLQADSLRLDNQAQISSATASGKGGNITLQANNLQLRNNSNITATAGGTGNGGNLTLNTSTLVGLENSDITANAVRGNGGNIQINTQGIFGLENRPQLTPGNDITASSQFGLSGNVAITNPEVETRSFLVELPQNLVDTSGQITTGCDPTQGNTFTIAGRGGLPEDPTSGLLGRAIWFDDRDLSADGSTASLPARSLPKSQPSPEIVEANGWIVNERGQVELVAHHSNRANSWQAPANCPPHQSSSLR